MRKIVWILALCHAFSALALDADNLLLITNSNAPEGKKLAEFYAQQRKVPAGRILEINLPFAEEISFSDYENAVIPAVREFIAKNKLSEKVTCLVTFYGVPLKIAGRVNTPGDLAELNALKPELAVMTESISALVVELEGIARELDPSFMPGPNKALPVLIGRDLAARQTIGRYAARIKDPAKYSELVTKVEKILSPLIGVAPAMEARMRSLITIANTWTPEQKKEAEGLRDKIIELRTTFDGLQMHRGDPNARSELRALVKAQLGMIEYARLLEGMIDYFNTENTDSAFDSELALVQWNFYSRANGLPNPINPKNKGSELPPILMTMRLDAPRPALVNDIISASIKAEADGLTGKAVVDSGGHLAIDSKNPSYAAFDQTLRNLAEFYRTKTKLTLIFDEKREVLPARSVQDVALYAGWYALVNYTPGCSFVPGAVGYHIASFELTTLRNENNRGWVRGLLNDGIAATLGAVNEPYLHAFPPPEEFFPLLMTGKLSLAEVYWLTTPMVSWRIAMIGDPLYTPYKVNPAVAPEALPESLQGALKGGR